MKKIYLSKELYNNLLIERRKLHKEFLEDDEVPNKLFLLGKNKNNVCVKSIELKKHGGCGNMPAVGQKTIIKSYLEFSTMRLVVGGFALLECTSGRNISWGGIDYGNAIFDAGGIPFLAYCQGRVSAQVSDEDCNLSDVKVVVVDKNFKNALAKAGHTCNTK